MSPISIANGTPFRRRNMSAGAASQQKQSEVPLQAEEGGEAKESLFTKLKNMFNRKKRAA